MHTVARVAARWLYSPAGRSRSHVTFRRASYLAAFFPFYSKSDSKSSSNSCLPEATPSFSRCQRYQHGDRKPFELLMGPANDPYLPLTLVVWPKFSRRRVLPSPSFTTRPEPSRTSHTCESPLRLARAINDTRIKFGGINTILWQVEKNWRMIWKCTNCIKNVCFFREEKFLNAAKMQNLSESLFLLLHSSQTRFTRVFFGSLWHSVPIFTFPSQESTRKVSRPFRLRKRYGRSERGRNCDRDRTLEMENVSLLDRDRVFHWAGLVFPVTSRRSPFTAMDRAVRRTDFASIVAAVFSSRRRTD